MEVLHRLNIFFGIMLVAVSLEFVVFSFTSEEDLVGQAFIVKGLDGEVGENYETILTKDMEDLIIKANGYYLVGEIDEAKKYLNQLMELRVKSGGVFPINKIPELLPGSKISIKKENNQEVGFIILDHNGDLIARESEDIKRVISNLNQVIQTVLYIFNPDEFSVMALHNTIKFNDRYYSYKRDEKGNLELKKSLLFWIDIPIKGELKKLIMLEMINSKIREGSLPILLDYGNLYYFEQKEVKRSVIEKTLFWMRSTL